MFYLTIQFYLPQSWQSIKGLIGKSGRDALKRRIWERDLEEISLEDAETAHSLIDEFKQEDVEVISKAAAVFYSWVRVWDQ